MEIISPFPLDSSVNLNFNPDHELRHSVSGPSSASDSFSSSSSTYGPFTPTSGRSTPLKPIALESSSYPQNILFDMAAPLSAYATGSFSSEKSDMTRVDYLGACIPDNMPPRQQPMEHVPAGMDYSGFVEMPMSQEYSSSAPAQASYDMYSMGERYRPRSFDSGTETNTVCMSDMYSADAYYPRSTAAIDSRPSLSTMAAFPSGDPLRGSDTESVGSPSVVSLMDAMSSPELPQRIAMGSRASPARRARASPAGRRGSEGQVGGGDKAHLGTIEIKRISAGGFKCEYPNCNKSFNRKEHLKRHVTATHTEVKIMCPFCKAKRENPFNRQDNFKHHVKMHAQPRSHGRVEYVPEAVEYYQKLVQDTKPRKPSKRSNSGGGYRRSPF